MPRSRCISSRRRAKDPDLGYATDFVTEVLAPNLKTIKQRGVRVVTNAGGVNPQACGQAVRALAERLGVEVKVAVVEGGDLAERACEFAVEGVTKMFTDAPFPDPSSIASIDAFLGAFPIAAALDKRVDIVLCAPAPRRASPWRFTGILSS